jgi:hypothetical protein
VGSAVSKKNRRQPENLPWTLPHDQAMQLSNDRPDRLGIPSHESTVVPMSGYVAAIEDALRSMHGACLHVGAEGKFIGRVESTDQGPLWLSAYWLQGARADAKRQWYLRYVITNPRYYTRDMLTMTPCIHLLEHPDRSAVCDLFYGAYYESDINFEVAPALISEHLQRGTKKLFVRRPS